MSGVLRLGILAMCALLLCCGCVSQHPVLSGEPTPAPTPSPTPEPLLQALPLPTPMPDAAGNAILSPQTHFDRYVSYRQMRVYEYELGTMLDGVCVNDYPQALSGAVEIIFTDEANTLLARAALYTAGETALVLQPGENRIYAEIDTDMDVQAIDFALNVTIHFSPLLHDSADRPNTPEPTGT